MDSMDERIIKYYENELSETERMELLCDAENDPDLRKEMTDYQNVRALTHLHESLKDEDAGNQSYQLFMGNRRRQQHKIVRLQILRYAAVFLFGILSTWIAYSILQPSSSNTIAQTLTVPDGQRAHIILPDGSSVWVNAHSTLHYPSAFGKERKVELSGEALFDIVKDDKHPFIVTTPNKHNIKVMGTYFNVFAYPKEPLSVSLLRGKVGVYQSDDEGHVTILLPNQKLTETAKGYVVSAIEENPILWKDGIYSFNKQRMGTIIKKLELYYDVKIIVKNPAISDLEISCKFRQRDGVMEILRLMQKVHPFQIKKDDEKNEIMLYQ